MHRSDTLQVELPSKEEVTYEIDARSTIDKAKAHVFRNAACLTGKNMKDYIFTLKLSVSSICSPRAPAL